MSPRSSEGGKPYKRSDGLWAVSVELPPGLDGKRRRKVITSKDRAAVIRRRDDLRKQLREAGDLPTASMTVAQWCDYWMREVGVKTRRPATFRSYRSILENWVKPSIGSVRLDKLTPTAIRKVLNYMENPTEGDPKSTTYMRNAHSVMAAVFADAERDNRIARNPVELVVAPVKAPTAVKALDADESVKLLTAFGDSPDAVLWATFVLIGARRGETIGLEWDRVTETELDLSWQLQRASWNHGCKTPCGYKYAAYCPKKKLSIPSGYEWREVKDGLYWTRPKSKAGWRIIPLVDPLASLLNQYRKIAPTNPWGLVFTRPDQAGNQLPLDPDYITHAWPDIRRAAGIDNDVHLHGLRHTAVDLLLAAGVPEDIVQEIVGHSTVTMTRQYKSPGNRARIRAGLLELSKSLGY